MCKERPTLCCCVVCQGCGNIARHKHYEHMFTSLPSSSGVMLLGVLVLALANKLACRCYKMKPTLVPALWHATHGQK